MSKLFFASFQQIETTNASSSIQWYLNTILILIFYFNFNKADLKFSRVKIISLIFLQSINFPYKLKLKFHDLEELLTPTIS